ncbi:MAG: cobalamin biosynthesis protein [Acidimicrobiales bacterium]
MTRTWPETVATCSLTEAGAALARRMPWEHRHGDLGPTVRSLWAQVDGLVLVCATGIAVRLVAPLLGAKPADPAVVVLDDAGRWAIALCGGHHGGNDLARQVAALVGAEAVVATATDAAGIPALDNLPGFVASGDVAGVTRRWLDGQGPELAIDPALAGWPVPAGIGRPGGGAGGAVGGGRVSVTDRDRAAGDLEVVLRPGCLVAGVGASSGARPEALVELLEAALAGAGLHRDAVGCVATLDAKRAEPAVASLARHLGLPVRGIPAAALAQVAVPHPSQVVLAAVGTPSVAEAAAVLAGGPGASLVVPKQRSADSTLALARRRRPPGHLAVVGLGPGGAETRTPQAAAAVRQAATVVGYGPYVDLAADLLGPHQCVRRYDIGQEEQRVAEGLRRAGAGEGVALVCSGDAGVYGMASLACEMAPAFGDPPLTVVAGVSADVAAAALLGAPLGHDHASVSLSDLLTPWPVIERRLLAVAEADMVVSLYNPRSGGRSHQLGVALALLGTARPAATPAAVVSHAGRPHQSVVRTSLGSLDPGGVGMLSLVVVGSSTTRWVGERMVTPRGYASPVSPPGGPAR